MNRPARSRTSRGHLLLLFLVLPVAASAQVPSVRPEQTPQRRADEKGRIRVEVNLVNILTSVTDKNGRPVADLPKEAFELYEEGVRQEIAVFEAETHQPLDLALMIDSSLSTAKELGAERVAATRFIRKVVRAGDRLAVFQFADAITQLSEFSADAVQLQMALQRIEPGAGTALYDAVFLGAQALSKQSAGRRRVLVLVTDAGETTSRADFDSARRAALRADALLYAIVIRPVKSESGRNTAGEHALETITETTGGAVYYPDSVAELDAMFHRIDRELRTQYRLGYYPRQRTTERSFRRVEVRVKSASSAQEQANYTVRHRRGYFTTGAPE